jgi:xanthine/uracil permease
MQIVVGLILVIVGMGMIQIARPKAGTDSALWLSKPWMLGQAYVLAVLIIAVIGIAFIFSGWPS